MVTVSSLHEITHSRLRWHAVEAGALRDAAFAGGLRNWDRSTLFTPRRRCRRGRLAPCLSATALQDAGAWPCAPVSQNHDLPSSLNAIHAWRLVPCFITPTPLQRFLKRPAFSTLCNGGAVAGQKLRQTPVCQRRDDRAVAKPVTEALEIDGGCPLLLYRLFRYSIAAPANASAGKTGRPGLWQAADLNSRCWEWSNGMHPVCNFYFVSS